MQDLEASLVDRLGRHKIRHLRPTRAWKGGASDSFLSAGGDLFMVKVMIGQMQVTHDQLRPQTGNLVHLPHLRPMDIDAHAVPRLLHPF